MIQRGLMEAIKEDVEKYIDEDLEHYFKDYFEKLLPKIKGEIKRRVVVNLLACSDKPGFELRVHFEPRLEEK